MRRIKLIILTIIFSLSSCHVFMGPDPDSSPRGIFDQIWNDFNENYALFNVKGIDWNKTYKFYSQKISPDMSDYELFRVCGAMLNSLEDIHVRLWSSFGDSILFDYDDFDYVDIYFESIKDFSFNNIRRYLKNDGKYAGGGKFLYGTFKEHPRVGYLHIKEFAVDFNIGSDVIPDWAKEINVIVAYLHNSTDSLVLDIRGNAGGLESNMDYIARRFVSVERPYLLSRTKNGPGRNDFSPFVTWTIKPAEMRYTKPIVLLTNENTFSAAEWFTMALRTQNNVTHMGTKTGGGFSTRIIRPLINGWKYSISVREVRDLDGKCYEGKGIAPVLEMPYNSNYFYTDTQLEEAVAWLSS